MRRAFAPLAMGALLAATIGVAAAQASAWPARIASAGAVSGRAQAASTSADPGAATAPDANPSAAMQAAYLGTQDVASVYAKALGAATSQMVTLLKGLSSTSLNPGDRYDLVWSSRRKYPMTVSPSAASGFSPIELAQLARGGPAIFVRDGSAGHVVVGAYYDSKDRVIASVQLPLSVFTGPLDSFRVGRQGRCFLIDATGNVLNAPDGQTLDVDRKALLPMLTGDVGTLETRSYVLSFAHVAIPGWYVVVQLPKTEASAGVTFPSDPELRMELPLDPPRAIERHWDLGPLLKPLAAAGGLALVAWLIVVLRRRRRQPAAEPEGDALTSGLDSDPFDLASLESGPDRLMPLEGDNLGKVAKRWTTGVEEIPITGDTPQAVASRVQTALRTQSRDQERMLQQLQHSLELTIGDTRDQVHEVLMAHQGKLKAIATALEQTRSELANRPDPVALAAVVDDLKSKLYDNESESRTTMSGVEKRLSTLTRKFSDLEDTLAKAVLDLQGRVSEDLFGRQEEINRAMEALEVRTRDVLRQVSNDAANSKIEGSKAAELAATLEASFVDLKTRLSGDIEELRKQASSDVSGVRAQVAAMEDLRAELKDMITRFSAGQAEWEEIGRQLSRKVNEELASMGQRIFDREGDVEKLRLLMEQAVDRVNRQGEELESKRQWLERDMDNLKGKLFLQQESVDKVERGTEARFTELYAAVQAQADKFLRFEELGDTLEVAARRAIDGIEGRFSAHIAETERRTKDAIYEALQNTVSKMAQLDAVREHGEEQMRREMADLEGRVKAILSESETRTRDLRELAESKAAEMEDKVYRAEVRIAQERAGLEDRLVERLNAQRERDLATLREEIAWQRYQEAETRQQGLEGIRAEIKGDLESIRVHQANLEHAIGEMARRMAAELSSAHDRDQAVATKLVELAQGLEAVRQQVGYEAAALADLTGRTEQLVASALAALPDHPELIGLHRDIEQLTQEAYRSREDSEQLRDRVEDSLRHIAEQHSEQYSKVTGLMQVLLKLYESAKASDEKVSQVLSSHASKVEGLHQEILAIRSMVVARPQGAAQTGSPIPLL